MTNYPHQGGTPEDKTSADFIYNKMKAYGLDDVLYTDYDVYLDFSDENKFNSVELKNASFNELFKIKEIDRDNQTNADLISKPYLAYSKSGTVTSVLSFFFVILQIKYKLIQFNNLHNIENCLLCELLYRKRFRSFEKNWAKCQPKCCFMSIWQNISWNESIH
jgi:hypothetical protein